MTASILQSIQGLETRVQTNPADFEALHDLSVRYAQNGRLAEALNHASKACELSPNLPEVWLNLGNIHAQLSDLENAVEAYRRAAGLNSLDSRPWFNLGNALARKGERQEAITAFEFARSAAPNEPQILASLALAYRKQNRLADSINTYRAARDADHGNTFIGSNLLVAMQYLPTVNDQTLYEEHIQWETRICDAKTNTPAQISKNKKPLRVGYVSGDFRRHPIGYFLLGVLQQHNKETVAVVCFSDTIANDDMTADLRRTGAQWFDTNGLDDTGFIQCVHDQEIDILIDLSGHLKHNRLTAFARRAAPVQASWAGYVGTTGLSEIDWLIADHYHAPAGFETWTSERIARLPHDYICYAPPEYAPAVASLPSDRNGNVTFGSFNNLVKVNENVLALWAEILSDIPGSRLILKCADLDQPDLRDWVLDIMKTHGVDSKRVDLREQSPHADLLQTYSEIDIALDTFPYSGGLTTLEALWMGVPVITMTGNSFAGRHSTSHLHAVGLADWIATDSTAYVALARSKASDLNSLRRLRSSLRPKMAQSPVCNANTFTRNLERLYEGIWQHTALSRTGAATPRVLDVDASGG